MTLDIIKKRSRICKRILFLSILFQGPLIYVNYGREQDFALLEAMRINVAGAVVIMRYSKASRSSKVGPIQTIIL